MIKFFRKIRQKLLTENKFSKYLIYAIGEIILVVIGILIALQINNWNQQNKKKDLELINLMALKKNLMDDLELEITLGLKYFADSEQAKKDISENYRSPQGLSNDSLTILYRTWLRREWRYVFNSAAFDNIKSIGIDIISSDSLRASVSSIYNHLYPNIIEDNVSTINHFEQQVLPLLNDSISQFNAVLSSNELTFLNSNKQLKNRIVYLTFLRDYLHNDLLLETKARVQDAIKEIDKELE